MNLGTKPVAGSLALTSAELDRFATAGVLRLGSNITDTITISSAIAPAGVNTLALISGNRIIQSSGRDDQREQSCVSRRARLPTCRKRTTSQCWPDRAGARSRSPAQGALDIGTVDGVSGISDNTISLKADNLTISQSIVGNNVTLAPRNPGAAMDLGSKPAGVFGITDAGDGHDIGVQSDISAVTRRDSSPEP
jgi:hypothetical protein